MNVSRRAFLGIAGVAVVGAAVPWLSAPAEIGRLLRSELPLPDPFTVPLPIPPVLTPRQDGPTDHYEITQRAATVELLPGVRTEIWGYDGIFPGPTIVSRPGRTTVVRQHNRLPAPTVVHLHGGHTPAADDGFPTDLVAAGQSRDYTYPMRQRAATLWYHDHTMDFTGPRVSRGLAGFHLVQDDEEAALGLPAGPRDIPLMIVDRAFAADGSLRYPSAHHGHGATAEFRQGVLGDVILVNGAAWPVLDVDAARYRLRFLNASNARRYRLALDPPPPGGSGLVQIGSDGGLLGKPVPHDEIDIAPAERFDVVVDFARYPVGSQVTLTNRLGTGGTGQVMRFRVARQARDDSRVPEQLSTVDELRRADAVTIHEIAFRSGDEHTWTINGKSFDPARTDVTARLGETQIWRLVTDFHHPVHLHLDHFQVLSRNGESPGPYDAGWKDTIDLRPTEAAEIIVRFTDHPGRYVFHCHNLEHEDMAMMATLEVRPG